MHTFGIGCLVLALAGCLAACEEERPAQTPSSHVYRGQQPAYGSGDPNSSGWSDPAALGSATHGPAQPGVTNAQPRDTSPR
jgi:hypothetical protein